MFQSSRVTILISKVKLNDRCFCYVTAAMFVPLRREQIWCLHTKLSKFGWHTSANSARIKQQRPDSGGGCLYCNHLSYPRFLNLFMEWLRFLVLITWQVKTENWSTKKVKLQCSESLSLILIDHCIWGNVKQGQILIYSMKQNDRFLQIHKLIQRRKWVW